VKEDKSMQPKARRSLRDMWQYVVCLARLGLAAFSSSLSRSEKVFFLEAPPGADVFTNDTAHEGIRIT
jgi:hypothetical protein